LHSYIFEIVLMNMTPSLNYCEPIASDFIHCLAQSRADREKCSQIENMLTKCNESLLDMKGVPPNASFCVDEIADYSRCSVNPNTSMCANEYKLLHECKLRRRRFLQGEDLGLVNMNPQARKRW
jgi:hypothetical protein